ncbi:hypothetical protein IMSHALPRED_003404, partial [Imshaugia aleurites]
MLRPTAAAVSALSSSQHMTIPSLLSRSYSKSSNAVPKADPDDSPIKKWLTALENGREAVPRNLTSVSYSPSFDFRKRGSSNTKATVQVPLQALSKEIPQEMFEGVRSLQSYNKSKDAL